MVLLHCFLKIAIFLCVKLAQDFYDVGSDCQFLADALPSFLNLLIDMRVS